MFVVIEASHEGGYKVVSCGRQSAANTRCIEFAARLVCDTISEWRVDPQATSNVKRRQCASRSAKRLAQRLFHLERNWLARERCFSL